MAKTSLIFIIKISVLILLSNSTFANSYYWQIADSPTTQGNYKKLQSHNISDTNAAYIFLTSGSLVSLSGNTTPEFHFEISYDGMVFQSIKPIWQKKDNSRKIASFPTTQDAILKININSAESQTFTIYTQNNFDTMDAFDLRHIKDTDLKHVELNTNDQRPSLGYKISASENATFVLTGPTLFYLKHRLIYPEIYDQSYQHYEVCISIKDECMEFEYETRDTLYSSHTMDRNSVILGDKKETLAFIPEGKHEVVVKTNRAVYIQPYSINSSPVVEQAKKLTYKNPTHYLYLTESNNSGVASHPNPWPKLRSSNEVGSTSSFMSELYNSAVNGDSHSKAIYNAAFPRHMFWRDILPSSIQHRFHGKAYNTVRTSLARPSADSTEIFIPEYLNANLRKQIGTEYFVNITKTEILNDTDEAGENMHFLGHVYFEKNKHSLTVSATNHLQQLITSSQLSQFSAIRIYGHTDSDASNNYNEKLADRRARKVAEYLQNNTAENITINVEGFGESSPKRPNNSIKNKQLNRRVEIYGTENSLDTSNEQHMTVPYYFPPRQANSRIRLTIKNQENLHESVLLASVGDEQTFIKINKHAFKLPLTSRAATGIGLLNPRSTDHKRRVWHHERQNDFSTTIVTEAYIDLPINESVLKISCLTGCTNPVEISVAYAAENKFKLSHSERNIYYTQSELSDRWSFIFNQQKLTRELSHPTQLELLPVRAWAQARYNFFEYQLNKITDVSRTEKVTPISFDTSTPYGEKLSNLQSAIQNFDQADPKDKSNYIIAISLQLVELGDLDLAKSWLLSGIKHYSHNASLLNTSLEFIEKNESNYFYQSLLIYIIQKYQRYDLLPKLIENMLEQDNVRFAYIISRSAPESIIDRDTQALLAYLENDINQLITLYSATPKPIANHYFFDNAMKNKLCHILKITEQDCLFSGMLDPQAYYWKATNQTITRFSESGFHYSKDLDTYQQSIKLTPRTPALLSSLPYTDTRLTFRSLYPTRPNERGQGFIYLDSATDRAIFPVLNQPLSYGLDWLSGSKIQLQLGINQIVHFQTDNIKATSQQLGTTSSNTTINLSEFTSRSYGKNKATTMPFIATHTNLLYRYAFRSYELQQNWAIKEVSYPYTPMPTFKRINNANERHMVSINSPPITIVQELIHALWKQFLNADHTITKELLSRASILDKNHLAAELIKILVGNKQWRNIGYLEDAPSVSSVEIKAWSPESVNGNINKILSNNNPTEKVLYRDSEYRWVFDNSQDTKIELIFSLHRLRGATPQPVSISLSLDDKIIKTISLGMESIQASTNVVVPMGRHIVIAKLIDPPKSHFVSVSEKIDNAQSQLIDDNTNRTRWYSYLPENHLYQANLLGPNIYRINSISDNGLGISFESILEDNGPLLIEPKASPSKLRVHVLDYQQSPFYFSTDELKPEPLTLYSPATASMMWPELAFKTSNSYPDAIQSGGDIFAYIQRVKRRNTFDTNNNSSHESFFNVGMAYQQENQFRHFNIHTIYDLHYHQHTNIDDAYGAFTKVNWYDKRIKSNLSAGLSFNKSSQSHTTLATFQFAKQYWLSALTHHRPAVRLMYSDVNRNGNAAIDIDNDAYSTYRKRHPKYIAISNRVTWLPTSDARITADAVLESDKNFALWQPNRFSTGLGAEHSFLNGMASLSYRFNYYFAEEDRDWLRPNYVSDNDISLKWLSEYFSNRNWRIETSAELEYDLESANTGFVVSLKIMRERGLLHKHYYPGTIVQPAYFDKKLQESNRVNQRLEVDKNDF